MGEVRFDAVTPDGRLLHFDDFIYTGDVVHDGTEERQGASYRVGEDRGDGIALLTELTQEEYMAHWRECNPRVADAVAHPCAVCGFAQTCGEPPGEDCHS